MGSREEIEAALGQYIRENYLPRNAAAVVRLDEDLFDSGILDSGGLVSFIGYLENRYELTIPDEDLLPENFSSLQAMTDYIFEKTRSVPARE